MRILICDDNEAIVRQLQGYIREFFGTLGGKLPELGVYDSGEALLARETRADMAFLDVEMPGVSGIHIGAKLKERNPYIKIFIVTAYPDYLDEAMRFQVFRYLSKPIDKNRLFRNLKDAISQYGLETREYPIVTQGGIVVRRAEEIVCVEARQRKVLVFTTEDVLQSVENMEHWRELLTAPCFFVTHRSFIVNMRFVGAVEKDAILLKHGEQERIAYLTRRKYSEFKNAFLLFMEGAR